MFLRQVKTKNGTIQLAIMKSYRDEQGKAKQKVVEYVGTLDTLQQHYDDPVAFFKEKAKRMTEQETQKTRTVRLDIDLDEELLGLAKAKQGIGQVDGRKNLGYAAACAIYHELEIYYFWDNRHRAVYRGGKRRGNLPHARIPPTACPRIQT